MTHEEIKAFDCGSKINLQSFNLTILEEIRKLVTKIKMTLLVDENETIHNKLEKLSYKLEIISPYFKLFLG